MMSSNSNILKSDRKLMRTMITGKTSRVSYVRNIVSAAASVAAAAVLVRSHMPEKLQEYVYERARDLLLSFSPEVTLVIEESMGKGFGKNRLYKAVEMYLSGKLAPSMQQFKVNLHSWEKKMNVVVDCNQEITDAFDGVELKWRQVDELVKADKQAGVKNKRRKFVLSFHKNHREIVMSSYLPYILREAKKAREEEKAVSIHTWRRGDSWHAVKLDHPATFETLAMDADVKENLIEDLERFLRRRDHYRSVGKAWKRGYLLHGPPGTGKSSLIAAMANHLKFDAYDMEIASVGTNSELKRLLMHVPNKSIIVVEDVDCSFSLNDRTQETKLTVIKRTAAPTSDSQNRVSLSGLLNFMDGLWSSMGDERIIVFTTNHIGRLDPALLRPGRMDVHIHMSYCTFCGFKTLAFNYLGLTDHPLFPELAQAICAAKATPAEVSEQLLRSEDADTAMAGLLEFLRYKIKCAESVETVVDKQVKTTESDKKAVAAAPRSRESGWKTVGTSSRVEDASFSVEDLMEFLQARREEITSSAIEWKNNVKKSEES